MTKEISKATMLQNKLRNQFVKKKTLEARAKVNNRRNICVSLVEKPKQNYCQNLDLRNINDITKLWDTVKLLFSNKIKSVVNFC